MLLKPLINFFTSLRLTVACLVMALILVFAGTLAQVHLGLYETQRLYFRSLFVHWAPQISRVDSEIAKAQERLLELSEGDRQFLRKELDELQLRKSRLETTAWRIPVWPGGYLLGGVLFVNLIAAHIKRFKFTWKKSGIFLTHAGLILLLGGQFLTELFQVESFMRLEEGETKNFSEDGHKNELAIVDVTSPDHDRVVVIPESMLTKPGEIKPPELPFTIRVKDYFVNSWYGGPMTAAEGKRVTATQGIGQRIPFDQLPPTYKMNDENKPVALVEIVTPNGSLGDWTTSIWLTKHPWNGRRALGGQLEKLGLGGLLRQPQQFTYTGHTYQIALRPVRYYRPHSVELLHFTHARYKGTDVAKDFSSRIHLTNPQTAENREVLIYMNNPLRYGGETYYQGGFDEDNEKISVLQVVRNPAWLTPYLSCTLVGLGLITQFLMHFFGFLKKSAQKTKTKAPLEPARPRSRPEPLEAAAVGASRNSNGEHSPSRTTSKRRNS